MFHFTCDHAAASIMACGALVPQQHLYLPALSPCVWMTSDPEPDRADVGLTSTYLACDRLEHRFRVLDASGCLPWLSVMAAAPDGVLPFDVLELLDRGCRPATWWVAFAPVPVVLG